MKSIRENAYAKINLGLNILGKREDGYHEVNMLMQTVSLKDTVTITEAKELGIKIKTNIPGLSCGQDNLAYKAAKLLADYAKISPSISISLNKKIFMAAGLAGGSADAAAVLRGLNRLWNLNLTIEQLEKLSAKLGSDIPFCIEGGTMQAKGRGEILTKLDDIPEALVVLAKPKGLEVSTAWVYKNYNPRRVIKTPDIVQLKRNLAKGMHACTPYMSNVLETVTIPSNPIIAQIKATMLSAGAYFALMSGSGPTVFAFCDDEAIAQNIINALTDFNLETAIVKTLGRKK
ncbi:MAG: 4-(cytidine 5'-diphospho)-2-C-methyl-D-erythritol kinase [Phascolarctobacterium sp.]|nr:4-(cytidine 5'-diphospho)-2-C-methyl-D-erythritol kinase [Phascolarctobacterium sp.]